MQLLRTLVAVSSLLCTASALVAAEPPAARDVDVENDPRSLWGDLEHLVPSGPVVDGCKILPCATDLLKTSAACLAAVAADLGSVVADLSCISVVCLLAAFVREKRDVTDTFPIVGP